MARLTIHADIDCNIYVDTEYYGIANADTDYSIELSSGVYWIECRSIEDNIPLYDFDFNAYDSSVDLRKDVSLLNSLRHKLLKARYDTVGEFIYGYARVQDKGVLIGYIDSTYQFLYDDVLVLYDCVVVSMSATLHALIVVTLACLDCSKTRAASLTVYNHAWKLSSSKVTDTLAHEADTG